MENQQETTTGRSKSKKPVVIVLVIGAVIAGLGLATQAFHNVFRAGHPQAGTGEMESETYEAFDAKIECAQKICSEVLQDLKEIDTVIGNYSDFKQNPGKYKFSSSAYDRCDPFEHGPLDSELANFYINIKKVNRKYILDYFNMTREQGLNIQKMLNEQYGCSDHAFLLHHEPSSLNHDSRE